MHSGTAPANDGTLLWAYTTGGGVFASPAVAKGVVYIGSADAKFYALNARTGAQHWSVAAGSTVRTAAVANGVVYFTSQDNIAYAVDALTGSVLASGSTGGAYFGGPSVADGRVYISEDSGNVVYALGLNAGADVVRRRAPLPSSLRPDMTLKITR